MTSGECKPARHRNPAALVFLLSASILAFEVSLMRVLLVAGWHHFAFLVVSVALLGFGASGVFLYLFRERVLPRGDGWLFALAAGAALAMPLGTALVQHLPIESRFLPALLARQLFWWFLYWLILLVPFLLGAGAIGLALMLAGERAPTVYAGNLAGSAAGAVAINLLMLVLPPPLLAAGTGALALAGACFAPGVRRRWKAGLALAAVALAAIGYAVHPPRIRTDPYKYHSFVRQLVRQGIAQLAAEHFGPKGVVSVYRSEMFHDLPFLFGDTAPPPMSAILLDGHPVASVIEVERPEQAGIVRQTLSAAAYELAPPNPAVLLPDELGGANIWLAALHDARRIDVVHNLPAITRVLRHELAAHGGAVLDLPAVRTHHAYPRHFLDTTRETYDLIHLVGLETQPAGSGGIGGLGQNHLMTVEGIATALGCLAPDGLLVASRGIQDPPRDNLKIMALFAAALRRNGVADPARHLLVVRDFLAVCTIAKPTPWTAAQLEAVAAMIERRQLTGVWFTGIDERHLNRPDWLPGPEGTNLDWYHAAAKELFSERAGAFIDAWLFDIRPPTDNRPFFHDFSKWGTIGRLREAFGDLWLTRAETAFLFVLATLVGVGVVALLATILPLAFVRPGCGLRTVLPAAGYFACLGLAYLMLEITLLAKLTRLIGDPLQAAATTIAAFLLFSGLGSRTAQSCRLTPAFMTRLILALALAAGLCMVLLGPTARLLGGLGNPVRFAAAVALIAPLAFLMGFPMAAGLARLHRGPDQLVAWAWSINGFASVLAVPLATLLAMIWGYPAAASLAVALYLVAGLLFPRIPAPE